MWKSTLSLGLQPPQAQASTLENEWQEDSHAVPTLSAMLLSPWSKAPYRGKGLSWITARGGESMEEAWQQVAGARSWELRSSAANMKERGNRKWDKAANSLSSPTALHLASTRSWVCSSAGGGRRTTWHRIKKKKKSAQSSQILIQTNISIQRAMVWMDRNWRNSFHHHMKDYMFVLSLAVRVREIITF